KDFIISAISEEMGAITAICITLVCLGCFMQMMVIATYMRDSFYKYVAVGLAIEYIVQVFLTIGGAIKFIPSTGVTLPFVSYGGSSLVSAFIVFAIIQALYIIQGNEDEFDEYEVSEDDSDFGVDTLFEDGFSDVVPGYRGNNVSVEDL
ncbi:MAG: FtsW/RodA/SpoVE family cell cycle protein, partial [Oribacterium sp.]|nr:FtsW/RodA/SpoVE family cell cycle protein [Oribacterium sp.]